MVETIAEAVFGYLKGKCKAGVLSQITDQKKCLALKQTIQNTLDDFWKQKLPYLTLEEEFDFGGLQNFLLENHDRLELYFRASGSDRDALLEVLRHEALVYAKPEKQEGRRLVLGCLDASLFAIEQLLLNEVDPKDLFLTSRTEENIRQEVERIVSARADSLHQHIDYRGSFAEYVDGLQERGPQDPKYHYRNPNIKFFGRKAELRYLDGFLEMDGSLLYTVITGPGGIGKSKLLYHYVQMNKDDPDWKLLFPSGQALKDMAQFSRFDYGKNLLLVVDYVGRFPELVGQLMGAILEHPHPPKVRLVLLERPASQDGVLPDWYRRMTDGRGDVVSHLYLGQFYPLELMGPEALYALMDNIAAQHEMGRALTDIERETILDRVHSFAHDDENGSPLYTILTTDAFLDGLPLSSMNPEQLLDHVLNRDEDYWEHTICGGEEKLFPAFKEMLVYATATDGWDFEPLGKPLVQDSQRLIELRNRGQEDLLGTFSELVEVDEEGSPRLRPLEPDLIGEYFVLNFLKDQFAGERYRQRIGLFWEKPLPYTYFLFRCIDSYLYQPEFHGLLYGEKTVFYYGNDDRRIALLTARLLVNLSAKQNLGGCKESVDKLPDLEQHYKTPDITLEYAKGLVNLSAKQELDGRKESVGKLASLEQRYKTPEFALEYAKGLVNLTVSQDLDGCKESVDKLYDLERHYNTPEIALEYAKGLVNLTIKQELDGAKESVNKLDVLEKHYKTPEIALPYARGLFNLTTEQELDGCKESVDKLADLEQRYKTPGIALSYADGLLNLTAEQELDGCKESVDKLYDLEQQYKTPEIALRYAKGLVNLTIKQELDVRKESIGKLADLEQRYKTPEIALNYARGLAHLCAEETAPMAVILGCMQFVFSWKADRKEVDAEPDSPMKTLDLVLLDYPDIVDEFMEWLLAPLRGPDPS